MPEQRDVSAISALDLAVEVCGAAIDVAMSATRAVGPLTRFLPRFSAPAAIPLGPVLTEVSRRGRERRASWRRDLDRLLEAVIPRLIDALLNRLDLTAIVHEHVDIDELVSTVDMETVVARIDPNAVARRLDLDALAMSLDVNTVASRIDVEAFLDRIDVTRMVQQRVDVNAIVRGVDLQAIVARLDLAHLAEEVIDAVDLPEIIRESSGSVVSETVRTVRMRGVAGDDTVGRAIERFLHHRGRQPPGTERPLDSQPNVVPAPSSPQEPGVPAPASSVTLPRTGVDPASP